MEEKCRNSLPRAQQGLVPGQGPVSIDLRPDQLDLILELKEQSDLGNPHARDWLSFAVKRLLTESGKKLAEEILASEHDSWWFDKKTAWWVNGSQLNRQRP